MKASTAATKRQAEIMDTYNTLIDNIRQLQVESRLADKKAALLQLAKFLHAEGYEQLAAAIHDKTVELVRKEYVQS